MSNEMRKLINLMENKSILTENPNMLTPAEVKDVLNAYVELINNHKQITDVDEMLYIAGDTGRLLLDASKIYEMPPNQVSVKFIQDLIYAHDTDISDEITSFINPQVLDKINQGL